MPSTLRWLLIHTSTPWRISSAAMSAWMSEKPTTKSGSQLEDLVDLRAGERADLRLLAARDRRAHGEAADADDAVLLAERVQRLRSAPRSGRRCVADGIGVTDTASASTTCRRRRARTASARAGGTRRRTRTRSARGTHAEAGPARRARHVAAFELALDLGQALLEGLARVQRLRLQRRPRAELAAARARGEIGVGLGVVDDLDRALDPHLHALRARAASGTAAPRADWPAARGPCGRRGGCRRRSRARRAPSAARCAPRGGPAHRRWRRSSRCGRARRPPRLREQAVEGGEDVSGIGVWGEVGMAHGRILAH